MPEQLTKHPEVTLQVLRSAGARCGEGAAQEILVKCPSARFCKLPGGEICVYGLADAGQMTQVSARELQALAPAGASGPGPSIATPPGTVALVAALALFLGLVIGATVVRMSRKRAIVRRHEAAEPPDGRPGA